MADRTGKSELYLRHVELTTYLRLVLKIRMHVAIPSLSHKFS
jgi:hypothetical protein